MTDTRVCWLQGSSGGVAADKLQPGHVNQVNVYVHANIDLYTYTEEGAIQDP